jgi:glycerophosphoryl diester phosphodiesterase
MLVLAGFALQPLTKEESLTVARFFIELPQSSQFDASEEVGVPKHVIRGRVEGETVEVLVDPLAARVLSITRGGERTYTWPGIVAVGHRGNVKDAPENTIAAFDRAIALGADLIEMDVRQTRDGHLVIMHDQSVARTTDGRGNVADLTLAEIKVLDAGSWLDARFKGERVPTFTEALEAIKGRALPDIDFKAGEPEKLVAAVREAGLIGKVTLYCGNWDVMKRVLALDAGFLLRPTAPMGLPGLRKTLDELDPPIVNMDWRFFSEELVREVHLAGKKAFVNTMGNEDNEASLVRAIDAGADYIQTDRMDLLAPLLRSRGFEWKPTPPVVARGAAEGSAAVRFYGASLRGSGFGTGAAGLPSMVSVAPSNVPIRLTPSNSISIVLPFIRYAPVTPSGEMAANSGELMVTAGGSPN